MKVERCYRCKSRLSSDVKHLWPQSFLPKLPTFEMKEFFSWRFPSNSETFCSSRLVYYLTFEMKSSANLLPVWSANFANNLLVLFFSVGVGEAKHRGGAKRIHDGRLLDEGHRPRRHSTAYGSASEEYLHGGPIFDPTSPTNVTAQLDRHAYLPCKIKKLDNKSVSRVNYSIIDEIIMHEDRSFNACKGRLILEPLTSKPGTFDTVQRSSSH